MSRQTNKHGLSRHIPAVTKRAVRVECGFGCIFCGCAIYEYEHIDPPFSEAREHHINSIGLLCPICHSKVTKGIFSKQKVKAARATPRCRQEGYSREYLSPSGSDEFRIKLGGATFIRPKRVLSIRGTTLFSLTEPESAESPFTINAAFTNRRGQIQLEIANNEIVVPSANWDVTLEGRRLRIWETKGAQTLQLRLDAHSEVSIERLAMLYDGFLIDVTENEISIQRDGIAKRLRFAGSIYMAEAAILIQ